MGATALRGEAVWMVTVRNKLGIGYIRAEGEAFAFEDEKI